MSVKATDQADAGPAVRPEILFPLFRPATSLTGVGPKSALAIGRAVGTRSHDGVPILLELLYHQPSRFVDRRRVTTVAEARDGEVSTLQVEVTGYNFSDDRRRPHRVQVADASGSLTLTFFNAHSDGLKKNYPLNGKLWVSGTIEQFGKSKQMLHPDYAVSDDNRDELPAVEAIYPSTAGLSAKLLRRAIEQAGDALPDLPDWIGPSFRPPSIRPWIGWSDAVRLVHDGAADRSVRDVAVARLAFDELLIRQVRLARRRKARDARLARNLTITEDDLTAALKILPFTPTADQAATTADIRRDLNIGRQTVRLVQGDVGSGKTAVAMVAAYLNARRGIQTAILAPTEVLVRQHYKSFQALFEPLGLRVVLLTGKLPTAERRAAEAAISSGEASVIIGTHALFQDRVTYHDLGYVVVDEQHRFGVAQRERLLAKGNQAHCLMMSATPIPRSMTMMVYGDLDVSLIREKPAGRKDVATAVKALNQSGAVYDRLAQLLDKSPDARAFWVCPLVDESDKMDATAAIARYDSLISRFAAERLGLVHGRLTGEEKDKEVERFAKGEAQLLVATTVIEVGVDVPNATVMVIESAERFGLAQLHQLRGRVGRGDQPGVCLLLYGDKLSDTGAKRLEMIRDSHDGFEIAELDIKLRGGGDVLGHQQTGVPAFNFLDLTQHSGLLDAAQKLAQIAVAEDQDLGLLDQVMGSAPSRAV